MTQRILLFLTLFLGLSMVAPIAHAQQHRKVAVTLSGGASMPAAYSAANAQSLLVSDLQGQSSVVVVNDGCNMFLDFSSGTATTAPANTNYELYVPSGTALVLDDIWLGGAVYARSATGGACTSGDVRLFFYGRRI